VNTRFANLDEMLMDPGKHTNDGLRLRSGGGSSDLIVGRGIDPAFIALLYFPSVVAMRWSTSTAMPSSGGHGPHRNLTAQIPACTLAGIEQE
jgi:hypothetical protein